MGHHRNLWKPSLCACVVEFSFDDALPDDQIASSIQMHAVHAKCADHAALSDQDAYDAVWAESDQQRAILLKLQASAPHLFISDASAAERNRQTVLGPVPTPDEQAHVDALSDDAIRAALKDAGWPCVEAGQLLPGATCAVTFVADGTGARVVQVAVSPLTAKQQTQMASDLTQAVGVPVSVRTP